MLAHVILDVVHHFRKFLTDRFRLLGQLIPGQIEESKEYTQRTNERDGHADIAVPFGLTLDQIAERVEIDRYERRGQHHEQQVEHGPHHEE